MSRLIKKSVSTPPMPVSALKILEKKYITLQETTSAIEDKLVPLEILDINLTSILNRVSLLEKHNDDMTCIETRLKLVEESRSPFLEYQNRVLQSKPANLTIESESPRSSYVEIGIQVESSHEAQVSPPDTPAQQPAPPTDTPVDVDSPVIDNMHTSTDNPLNARAYDLVQITPSTLVHII
jgi:hypothetical protein